MYSIHPEYYAAIAGNITANHLLIKVIYLYSVHPEYYASIAGNITVNYLLIKVTIFI